MATTTTARGKRDTETATTASVDGKRGIDILHDPVLNKATAYTEAERQALGLVGLVPDATESETSSSAASCNSSIKRPPTWSATST
jgi:hypothetical protein